MSASDREAADAFGPVIAAALSDRAVRAVVLKSFGEVPKDTQRRDEYAGSTWPEPGAAVLVRHHRNECGTTTVSAGESTRRASVTFAAHRLPLPDVSLAIDYRA
jgi:hypothetical protein